MSLLTVRDVSLGYGGDNLFDHIHLTVTANERVCLVGRNGQGKSTLLKLIAGQVQADDGRIDKKQDVKISYLIQEVPQDLSGSVFDVVASGLDEAGQLLTQYHHASLELAENYSDNALQALAKIQQQLESVDGWTLNQQIESTLSLLELSMDVEFASLSGGLKRRVMLARALVTQPDLLLLDEPTNHLDIAAIEWLEKFLLSWKASLLFVTHDRSFLKNLATRIIELDRGQLTSWPGNYDNYLQKKQEALEVEAKENALFDKKLAQEEVWIRQGIKARRTRNEGRVRALEALREERAERRDKVGNVKMQLSEQERSGKLVMEAKNISYGYDDKTIVKDFSVVITRGDRIGILGPNGVGKTTLINLLLGNLQPQRGTVQLGTKLEVAYFDQLRSDIDLEKSVRDNVALGSDVVNVGGKSKHVMSYLSDFLFAPQRANSPASTLSGGERNRLMLAKLFTKSFNLLVMDEPTNDLDVETLELLEELLMQYQGTLMLVSHDREFIDNVVTSTLVFEGEGRIGEYVGGYEDWLRQRSFQEKKEASSIKSKDSNKIAGGNDQGVKEKPKKRSYKDQRELDALPQLIEKLEQEQSQLMAQMSDPNFYQQAADAIARVNNRVAEVEQQLEKAYERWQQLE